MIIDVDCVLELTEDWTNNVDCSGTKHKRIGRMNVEIDQNELRKIIRKMGPFHDIVMYIPPAGPGLVGIVGFNDPCKVDLADVSYQIAQAVMEYYDDATSSSWMIDQLRKHPLTRAAGILYFRDLVWKN